MRTCSVQREDMLLCVVCRAAGCMVYGCGPCRVVNVVALVALSERLHARCMLHAPSDRAALRKGQSSDWALDPKDRCCTVRADAARRTAQVACWSLHDACCMLSAAAQRDLLIPYAGRDFAVDFPACGESTSAFRTRCRQDGSRRAGCRDAIRGAKRRS